MSHQKRLAATKRMPIERKKGTKYVACPSPGPHKKKECMPVILVLRDLLNVVETSREVKKTLNAKKILINGKPTKDHKLPIGFFDEITIPEIKENYLVTYNKLGKFEFKKQNKLDSKPLKILGKKSRGKGKTQINLFTGKNIIVTKDIYKVGDSLILEDKKISKHIKLEKGAKVFLTAGKHIGYQGVVEEITPNKNWSQPQIIVIKSDTHKFETLKNYAYVLDKEI
jgi:small subunit ribosomal protein S4e